MCKAMSLHEMLRLLCRAAPVEWRNEQNYTLRRMVFGMSTVFLLSALIYSLASENDVDASMRAFTVANEAVAVVALGSNFLLLKSLRTRGALLEMLTFIAVTLTMVSTYVANVQVPFEFRLSTLSRSFSQFCYGVMLIGFHPAYYCAFAFCATATHLTMIFNFVYHDQGEERQPDGLYRELIGHMVVPLVSVASFFMINRMNLQLYLYQAQSQQESKALSKLLGLSCDFVLPLHAKGGSEICISQVKPELKAYVGSVCEGDSIRCIMADDSFEDFNQHVEQLAPMQPLLLPVTLKSGSSPIAAEMLLARRPVNRLFGVLRHAERADMLGSRVNGESWTLLEESKDFPIDPPLSDHGQQEAARVAVTVRTFADRNGSELHVVVSSLYLRCVETAIQVCKQLGPATKLILDHSLGEVFGHAVLGDQKPLTTWHSPSYLVRYARSQGVRIVKKVCGKVPVWPETLRMARMRYASTFLGYLRRSEICRRNFVLVSHADCIASVLAIIPSKAGRIVESVSTGASVLGLRSLDPRKTPKVYHVDEGASEDSDPPARSTKGGWTVELNGVQMGPRWRNGETASRAAQRALQGNGNFVLSARALEGLLGGLSQEPLGDRSPKGTKRSEISQDGPESSLLSPGGSEQSTFGDGASCCSSSTMLFGASETGSEYDISPTSPRTDGDFDMLKPHTFCAAESIQRPNSTGGLMNNDAVRRSRFLTTEFSGTLSSVRGSSVRSSSAGRVTLQGCNGSAILARRRNMAGN